MIRNNLEIDVKVKCIEEGIRQEQFAEKVGRQLRRVIELSKMQRVL